MSGHSQFKNIMHRKGLQDQKKAKIFTKIMREISVAAKIGGVDPQFNSRLRSAIYAAKEENVPRDKIETQLKKANSVGDGMSYEEVRYEGYGRHGVALIVEAITDNRNRTVSEVRSILTRHGGALGENGSVSYMFKHIGSIVFESKNISDFDHILMAAIEVGADDCIMHGHEFEVICRFERFNNVKEGLEEKYGNSKRAQVLWLPITTVLLGTEAAKSILNLAEALEDNDDVQRVTHNCFIEER